MRHATIMQSRGAKVLAMLMALAVMITMMPAVPTVSAASNDTLYTPEFLVTGDGLLDNGAYTAATVTNEKAYTLEEMKAIAGTDNYYVYSGVNKEGTPSFTAAHGVKLADLLGVDSTVLDTKKVTILSKGNYKAAFDPAGPNQNGTYSGGKYSKIGKDFDTNGNDTAGGFNLKRYKFAVAGEKGTAGAAGVEIPTVIAWQNKEVSSYDATDSLTQSDPEYLRLLTGQVDYMEMNAPLFNGKKSDPAQKAIVGDAIEKTVLKVGTTDYTRASVLMMQYVKKTYSYSTSGGDATDTVKAVPLSVLLKDYADGDVVTFHAADGYDVAATGMTKKELIDGGYTLAYEVNGKGIFETAKKDATKTGFFRLYADEESPAKLIDQITVTVAGTDYSKSPYKHITNGGLTGQDGPFDIDGITGATLTIEGPGVEASVPLPVRDLESQNKGAFRGVYSDVREGTTTQRTYEGIDLYYLLHDMKSGTNGITLTKDAYKVQIKNRNRQTTVEFTLKQIEEAHEKGKPIIISYGTGNADGTNPRPYVFDGAAGSDSELGNEDGCLKLVYDPSVITGDTNNSYTKFTNMAYVYVCEQAEPGYKHIGDIYGTPENLNYVLTITGKEIGREVNYTVQQLEDMVTYKADGTVDSDNCIGYRDEYSLANSTYWYVNRYEGVKLWDLLLKSGLPASKGTDEKTKATFEATDGYTVFDEFTLKQVADPDQFGFYEKNAADVDASYVPVASDLKKTGYPVMVSYGVNGYPYVQKNSQPGYLSGLANDGGPLRIISGKINYKHANGSNQAKLLDKVIVGDNTYHYSTHKYNDPNTTNGKAYTDLAESQTLEVRIVNGSGEEAPVLKSKTYKLGDLEALIYGGSLTKTQLSEAKVKAFYETAKNGSTYSDLYEGVNLIYFLKNVVELPGFKGTVTFSNGSATIQKSLEDVLSYSGTNITTTISGLTPLLAYAKNGTPLVASKDSVGYEKEVTLAAGEDAISIKNNDGPLELFFPSKDGKSAPESLANITSITINLSPDQYAHTDAPYNALENKTISITGEGIRNEKTYTISELEGKQTLAVTGDYSFLNTQSNTSQLRYRGIGLYALLKSSDIGLKSNADKVILKSSDGTEVTLPLADVMKENYINSQNTAVSNLKPILAYGSAPVTNADREAGKPLVQSKNAADGYVAEYSNNGGPLKFVIGQKDATDVNSGSCLKDVVSIEVTAAASTSWNHSASDVFKTYLNNELTLTVVDINNKELFKKVYKVSELEAMTSIIEKADLNSTSLAEYEGLNIWKFLMQEIGSIAGTDDPTGITVVSGSDNFSSELRSKVGLDALKNGVKDGDSYFPVLLCYGTNGLPLVIGDKSITIRGEGYDPLVGNDGGPLKLMVHNAQGACLTNVNQITVKVGGTATEPSEEKDFNIYGLSGGTKAYDVKGLKNSGVKSGVQTATFTHKKGTETVRGVLLSELLDTLKVSGSDVRVTFNTTDGYEDTADAAACYKDVSLATIAAQKYLVAYDITDDGGTTWTSISDEDKSVNKTKSTIRIYRNMDDGKTTFYNRLTNIKGITISGASGGGDPEPEVTTVDTFTIKSNKGEDKVYGIGGEGGIKRIKEGAGGAAENAFKYTKTEVAYNDSVVGISLKDLLKAAGFGTNVSVTINTTDGFETKDKAVSYRDITYADIVNKDYFVAYNVNDEKVADADKNGTVASFRIYRNEDDGSTWQNCVSNVCGITISETAAYDFTTVPADGSEGNLPMAGLRAIKMDKNGGLWIGTYGGGFAYRAADGETFVVSNKSNVRSMQTTFVSALAVDKWGGVWFTQNASYTDPTKNAGVGYYKEGEYRYYTEAIPNTIPNNYVQAIEADDNGNVWFGSFGGLTKYDGRTWTTMTEADGLPAASVSRIELDGNGGLWVGFYPNGGGADGTGMDQTDPFAGGFAYVKDGKVVKAWKETAAFDSVTKASRLGDVWVRDIAVDKKGGAWIIASGSYAGMNNVGGTVWYVDANKNATKYTGHQLLGQSVLNGAANAEIRIVDVDPEGGLWFGTSADGVIYVKNPVVKDNSLTVTKEYSTATGAWGANVGDNVYAMAILNDTLYVGTAKGLAYKDYHFTETLTYTIKASAGSNGKISNAGDTSVVAGGSKTYVITPDSGYEVEDVLVDGTSVGKVTSYTFSNVTGAHTISVTFKATSGGEGSGGEGSGGEGSGGEGSGGEGSGGSGSGGGDVTTIVGNGTKSDYDFKITGEVEKDGYFKVDGLGSYKGLKKLTKTISWKNTYGSSGKLEVEGVALSDLLNLAGVKDTAKSVSVKSDDGYYRSIDFGTGKYGVDWKDKDGNPVMIAWKVDGEDKLQLIIGQESSDDVNRDNWVSNITNIVVNKKDAESSGGSKPRYSGGGGGTTDDNEKEDVTTDIKSTVDATVKVKAGTATATVDAKTAKEAIANGVKDAKANAEFTLKIDATTKETTTKTSVQIPAAAVKAAIEQGNTALAIETSQGEILLTAEMLKVIDPEGTGDITVTTEAADTSALSAAAKAAVGDRPVVDITVANDGKTVSAFGGKMLKASIDYKATGAEAAEKVVPVYISEAGDVSVVKMSAYDKAAGTLTFATGHCSLYGVSYKDVFFTDLMAHWAKNSVDYLAAREIVNGRTADTFVPEGSVTRAEFVKLLASCLDSVDVTSAKNVGFNDVKSGDWYANYVNWAAGNGIVNGFTDGTFRPNEKITREQMAIMLQNFMEYASIDTPVVKEKITFTDADAIQSYAKSAVTAMQQRGILSGYLDGSFKPEGTATRAEAASMLTKFIQSAL